MDKKEKFTADLMQVSAKNIKETFRPFNMGFVLIVFPFGNPGISNYVADAERGDMIKLLRETADRLEKNQDKRRY